MFKKILLLAALVLLLSPNIVLAQSCTISSVTANIGSTRVTTGTSVTISSTSYASESSCNADVRLVSTGDSTRGSLSVTDPAATYYPSALISTSGTTKTFTVTGPVADTYTWYVQTGSTQSTSTVLTVYDSAAFTVTGTPSTQNVSAAGSFTLSISVSNPYSSAVSSSYELTGSTGLSFTGDPSSNTVSLSGGSTAVYTWTVTAASTCTDSKTISFRLGSNSGAFTGTVNCPSSSNPTPTPGGGVNATPTPTVNASTTPGTEGGSESTSSPKPSVKGKGATPAPGEEGGKDSGTGEAEGKKIVSIQDAKSILNEVKSLLADARSKGLDVSEAEHLLELAQKAFDAGEYSLAKQYAEQAKALLQQRIAALTPSVAGIPVSAILLVALIACVLAGGVYYYKFKKKE